MTLSPAPAGFTRKVHRPPPLAHLPLRRNSVLATPEDFLHGCQPCARVVDELNCPTTPTTPIPQTFRSDLFDTRTSILSSPVNLGETQQWYPESPTPSGIYSVSNSSRSSSSSSTHFPSSSSSSSLMSFSSFDMPEARLQLSSANIGGDAVPTTPTTPIPGSPFSGSSSSNFPSAGTEPISTSRNGPIQANINQIFQFQRWKPTKQESIPKLNETQPLSLYFHADEKLTAAVKALSKIRDPQSEKYRQYTDRVHRAQNQLLKTVYFIYNELDDHMKSPRYYRRHLPVEDQAELDNGFSENILYAAEALSRGFRIHGIENFTDQLVEPGKQLCASFEALRFVFRCRALELNRSGSSVDDGSGDQRLLTSGALSSHLQNLHAPLYPVLVDFDKAWTVFEKKICFAHFAVTYNRRYGTPLPTAIPNTFPSPHDFDTELFSVLVSESLIRATTRKLVTWKQIQECHPAVMFAIPRLSIVAGLVHMPECVNMTDPETSFWWFREKVTVLQQLQKSLRGLSTEELDLLERALVGEIEDDDDEKELATEKTKDSLPTGVAGNFAQSDISSTLSKLHIRLLFTTVCSIADGLQSGPRARDFSNVLERVFNCHS